MSEELGKIEKPSTEEFKEQRKLYFIPLIYAAKEAPLQDDYIDCWTDIDKKFDGTPGTK